MADLRKKYTSLVDSDLKLRLDKCLMKGDCLALPHVKDEAEEVLTEIMERARANVQIVVRRLSEIGYRFRDTRRKHVYPLIGIDERLSKLEANGVFVPISLKAWFRLVGSVNLMGSHRDCVVQGQRLYNKPGRHDGTNVRYRPEYTDPLVVEDVFLDETFENWRFRLENSSGSILEPCYIEIAPDARHKENVSGGAGYKMSLAQPTIDTVLHNEPHNVNFVDYLRIAFWWGGLPGAEFIPEFPMSMIEELRKGLLPI